MVSNAKYCLDVLIVEKLLSGRWIAEPSTGKIYSKDIGGYLKPYIDRGYQRVRLASTHVTISRVIWIAAHGIPELPFLQIDHINENKLDNRLENLRLISPAGNTRHSKAKLTYDEAETIRREYAAGGVTQQTLADHYSLARQSISKIIHNKRYRKPERIVEIDEEVKAKIFTDICYKGNLICSAADKYKLSADDIIAVIEEQSLKIEISRKVNN